MQLLSINQRLTNTYIKNVYAGMYWKDLTIDEKATFENEYHDKLDVKSLSTEN